MNLVNLLIQILFAGLIIYAIYWVLGMLTLPAPIKQIILVIVAVLALIWILGLFTGGAATGLTYPVR
jgi:hypothetical protein